MQQDLGLMGMRGIAALLVVAFHIILYSPFSPTQVSSNYLVQVVSTLAIIILFAGYSGVYLFFIISGYILVKKYESGDYNVDQRFSRAKYYMRRIFRTWPLYFLVIPVFAFINTGTLIPIVWQSFFFVQNFFPSTFVNNPTWTLIVEEVFYLFLPVWIILFRRNWKIALLGTAAFTIGYMAVVRFVLLQTSAYSFAQFPAFAFTFALGTLIAYNRKVKVNWILILAAWVLASFVFSNLFTEGAFAFVPVIFFSGIYFLVVCNLDSSRLFTNGASVFLGKLAYPIYLFGLPIQFLLMVYLGRPDPLWIPLTIMLTIAIAYVINVLIEKPFISLGRKLESMLVLAPSAATAEIKKEILERQMPETQIEASEDTQGTQPKDG
ncbi:MAG: acyltransferase [Candidatus Micrarchaeota archaeon]|nr:acyltransferase [Candidatus Micrarchaeota archaeon]